MKASYYGLENFKENCSHYIKWSYEEWKSTDDRKRTLFKCSCPNKKDSIGHNNNGGEILEDIKSYDQDGPVYVHVIKNNRKSKEVYSMFSILRLDGNQKFLKKLKT